MNEEEFKKEMRQHHETGEKLAEVLGITPQGFCKKKKRGGFTQAQIKKIAQRYEMSAERVCVVFDLL